VVAALASEQRRRRCTRAVAAWRLLLPLLPPQQLMSLCTLLRIPPQDLYKDFETLDAAKKVRLPH